MLSSFKRMSKGSKSHLTIYSKERRGFHNERNFAFWPSEYKIDLCTINEANIDNLIVSEYRSLPELKPGENITLLTTKRQKLPFMK